MYFFIVLGLVLTIISMIALKIHKNIQHAKHIPGVWQVLDVSPCYIPILSPYIYMGSGNALYELARKNGYTENGLFRVTTISSNIIFVWDREMLKDVHSRKLAFFPKSFSFLEPIEVFGENIISAPDTDAWKKHHNTLAPAFTSNNLEYMADVSVETVDTIGECVWNPEIDSNGEYVLKDSPNFFTNLTTDVLAKSAFGASFSIFVPKEQEFNETVIEGRKLKKSLDVIFDLGFIVRVTSPIFLRKPLFKLLGIDEHMNRFTEKIHQIMDHKKQEIERDGEVSTRDVLSLMIQENLNNKQLTNDQIFSNTFVLFFAGMDTSANTMQWLLYEIARSPSLQKRLHEEVDKVLPNKRKPTFNDYNDLNLVTSCIHETLRLHAPITDVAKECIKPVQLGSYHIPKGATIHPFLTAANKNPQVWQYPFSFDPDRFNSVDLKSKAANDFSLLSFSMGLRKCLGMKFALIEITCVMTRMLQLYQFELLNDESVDPVMNSSKITYKPDNLRVRITKRNDN